VLAIGLGVALILSTLAALSVSPVHALFTATSKTSVINITIQDDSEAGGNGGEEGGGGGAEKQSLPIAPVPSEEGAKATALPPSPSADLSSTEAPLTGTASTETASTEAPLAGAAPTEASSADAPEVKGGKELTTTRKSTQSVGDPNG
jgi:hypothetical protein